MTPKETLIPSSIWEHIVAEDTESLCSLLEQCTINPPKQRPEARKRATLGQALGLIKKIQLL